MGFCHREHQNASLSAERVILFEPDPVSHSGSSFTNSWITISIGQATLSWYEPTVTVFCIVYRSLIFFPHTMQKSIDTLSMSDIIAAKTLQNIPQDGLLKWRWFQKIFNLEKGKTCKEGNALVVL